MTHAFSIKSVPDHSLVKRENKLALWSISNVPGNREAQNMTGEAGHFKDSNNMDNGTVPSEALVVDSVVWFKI